MASVNMQLFAVSKLLSMDHTFQSMQPIGHLQLVKHALQLVTIQLQHVFLADKDGIWTCCC